jgi:hypothetical protein
MFRHYYEVELIGLRGCDDVFKGTGAVTAEKRVDVHDALVLDQSGGVRSYDALRIHLLNRGVEPSEFVTTIGEGELRDDRENQQD